MKFSLFLILISLVLYSCGGKSDKDLFDDGKKFLDEGKITESLESFEMVVREFPESDLAPQALTHLAGIYQSKKVQTISPKVSLNKADSLFYVIFSDYPNSDQAPLALFMSGFIQANELGDFQKATKTYTRFLEVYPDHELATSAKEELENMGLSPEEILRKNLADKD